MIVVYLPLVIKCILFNGHWVIIDHYRKIPILFSVHHVWYLLCVCVILTYCSCRASSKWSYPVCWEAKLFLGQQNRTVGHAPTHEQRRELWSPAAPKTRVLPQHPPSQNQRTWTWTKLEHWNTFRSKGSTLLEDPALMPFIAKFQDPPIKTCLISTPAYLFPRFLKTLHLIQRARWIWGTIRSPIFLVVILSINKIFLILKSNFLSIGLSKCWDFKSTLLNQSSPNTTLTFGGFRCPESQPSS